MVEVNRRKFLGISLLSILGLGLVGCSGYRDDMTMEEILALIKAKQAEDQAAEEDEGGGEDTGPVVLNLTYPAGKSPSVFMNGWVFGARCAAGGDDLSNMVQWGGTASFSPEMGSISRPVFNSEGSNTIILTVNYEGKNYRKSYKVNAISPAGFASIGDKAKCPADAHGCPACPHTTIGPITTGSPNVFVNGKPAARVGDTGVHAACCGPNKFTIVGGTSDVLINGRRAAKKGDATQHCGGEGYIISGAA
jgi:uncharacterized Zn-binding protein involved in type VI secretion